VADTTVFNLTATTTAAAGDLVPVVDVSDTTQSANGSTRKITLANLKTYFSDDRALLNPTVTTDSDGTRTLATTDNGDIIKVSHASANAVAINTDFNGLGCTIVWTGTAAAPVLTPTGVTLNGASSAITGATGPGMLAIIPTGTNTFDVIGSINTPAVSIPDVALTDGANISVNAALSNNFYVVLGGNRTLDNPTNPANGQVINIRIRQDATGSRTLAFGTKYLFAGGTDPTISTGANDVDFMSCKYDAVLDAWLCSMTLDYA
jgi:hypothetical protein